jgi:DNA-binding CsgD family transcriptional regulator
VAVKLTRREEQLVEGVLAGKTNREIAFDLKIKENTVKVYFGRLYPKLGIKRKMDLLKWALSRVELKKPPIGTQYDTLLETLRHTDFTRSQAAEILGIITDRLVL